MAIVFHHAPLNVGTNPLSVTHVSELRPIYLALLPVIREAFKFGINEVTFALQRDIDAYGEFNLWIRCSVSTYQSHAWRSREMHRGAGGSFAPLLPPKGICKKLEPVMAKAFALMDHGLLAAFAADAWTIEAWTIGELERSLGRDWEIHEFIPVRADLEPSSIFRYFL